MWLWLCLCLCACVARRLTEKKALKARMSAMANRARANTDASEGAAATPDEEDTPGEVDDGAAAAALAKKSARALAAETARRAKQAPRPGRRTLQSTDFNYDGPLAQVAEVDCQCTCGAALEEGAAGDGDGVQHAEDCALFNGLLAPDVAPTPLRTSQSTMRLRSTADVRRVCGYGCVCGCVTVQCDIHADVVVSVIARALTTRTWWLSPMTRCWGCNTRCTVPDPLEATPASLARAWYSAVSTHRRVV